MSDSMRQTPYSIIPNMSYPFIIPQLECRLKLWLEYSNGEEILQIKLSFQISWFWVYQRNIILSESDLIRYILLSRGLLTDRTMEFKNFPPQNMKFSFFFVMVVNFHTVTHEYSKFNLHKVISKSQPISIWRICESSFSRTNTLLHFFPQSWTYNQMQTVTGQMPWYRVLEAFPALKKVTKKYFLDNILEKMF